MSYFDRQAEKTLIAAVRKKRFSLGHKKRDVYAARIAKVRRQAVVFIGCSVGLCTLAVPMSIMLTAGLPIQAQFAITGLILTAAIAAAASPGYYYNYSPYVLLVLPIPRKRLAKQIIRSYHLPFIGAVAAFSLGIITWSALRQKADFNTEWLLITLATVSVIVVVHSQLAAFSAIKWPEIDWHRVAIAFAGLAMLIRYGHEWPGMEILTTIAIWLPGSWCLHPTFAESADFTIPPWGVIIISIATVVLAQRAIRNARAWMAECVEMEENILTSEELGFDVDEFVEEAKESEEWQTYQAHQTDAPNRIREFFAEYATDTSQSRPLICARGRVTAEKHNHQLKYLWAAPLVILIAATPFPWLAAGIWMALFAICMPIFFHDFYGTNPIHMYNTRTRFAFLLPVTLSELSMAMIKHVIKASLLPTAVLFPTGLLAVHLSPWPALGMTWLTLAFLIGYCVTPGAVTIAIGSGTTISRCWHKKNLLPQLVAIPIVLLVLAALVCLIASRTWPMRFACLIPIIAASCGTRWIGIRLVDYGDQNLTLRNQEEL